MIARIMQLDAHGSLSKATLYPQLLTEFGLGNLSTKTLAAVYEDRFHEHPHPMVGALDLLHTLRSNQIKLSVVTNGWTDFQNRTTNAIGIRDTIDVILI